MTARQPPGEKGGNACTIGLYRPRTKGWYFCTYFSGDTEKEGVFIYTDKPKYEVSTYWGWFRLDEGAYRDYLAGKLWICWYPKNAKNDSVDPISLPDMEPHVDVSAAALALFDAATKSGVYAVLQKFYPGSTIIVPYRKRMADVPIEEMNLSVRSTNGLKRANAHTFGSLKMLMELEAGLKGVRNLGIKSEKEIKQGFLTTCYSLLSKGEKLEFWQRVLDSYAKVL